MLRPVEHPPKMISVMGKHKRMRTTKDGSPVLNIMQMLNDPQTFAEKIHANLKKSNDTFDCKLLMMNVLIKSHWSASLAD